MFEVKIFKGREAFDAGLVERVVEFDKRNMRRAAASSNSSTS